MSVQEASNGPQRGTSIQLGLYKLTLYAQNID